MVSVRNYLKKDRPSLYFIRVDKIEKWDGYIFVNFSYKEKFFSTERISNTTNIDMWDLLDFIYIDSFSSR